MIRVAVIGAGHWGPNLIANFHSRRRSEVAWVVDREPGRLEVVRARFPEIQTSADAERALQDATVQAVVVATPTSTHYELARAALRAGKHVLVEKPIAACVADAASLCELAEGGDRVLMAGHVFVYNRAAQEVKRYIESGELGRIFYISMVRTNLGPIRVDVDVAWDLAAHDVSLASYWLDAGPQTASAIGGSWVNAGIDDAAFATLRYPAGVLVNTQVSWLSPRKAREITVVGDRKMLTFDDMSLTEPLRIYDKRVAEERSQPAFVDSLASFRMSVRDGDIVIPKIPASEPLRNECEHFLDCIAAGKTPLTGAREGLAVVRVLDAIARSRRKAGAEVRV